MSKVVMMTDSACDIPAELEAKYGIEILPFTLSIDDFVISFFVAGPGSTTLPIRIYSMIKHGSPPMINALSTLLLVITFSAVVVSQRVGEGTPPGS